MGTRSQKRNRGRGKGSKLTTSAAHLSMCPNEGKFGFIVLSSGRRGPTVGSKRFARKFADSFYRRGMIAPDELQFLKSQIDESILPEETDPVNELTIGMSDIEKVDADPPELEEIFEELGEKRTYH